MYKFNYDVKEENFNKKLKFAELDLIDRNKPDLLLKHKSEFIHHENFLLLTKNNNIKKEIFTVNENKLSDNLEDKSKIPNIRIDGVDIGAGRGFGNLKISNDIRNGEDSRSQNNKFKKIKEAEVIDRFEFLDKDLQNPRNLILPFPRGGEITRKKPLNKKELDDKKFSFKY
jgi:hypothetical protein